MGILVAPSSPVVTQVALGGVVVILVASVALGGPMVTPW